jgi:hypothetical protein
MDDDIIEQDRKENPGCSYSRSSSESCSLYGAEGKMICDIAERIHRMCPGRAPVDIHTKNERREKDSGSFSPLDTQLPWGRVFGMGQVSAGNDIQQGTPAVPGSSGVLGGGGLSPFFEDIMESFVGAPTQHAENPGSPRFAPPRSNRIPHRQNRDMNALSRRGPSGDDDSDAGHL